MTLTKLMEVQKGKRTLRLFRAVESGMLFVAVDKVVGARTIKGPFLSEHDLRGFLDIVNRHKEKRREWAKFRAERQPEQALQSEAQVLHVDGATQLEIEEAICRARERQRTKITVIPSLPKYTYCHTCKVCGCHIESHLRLGPGTALKLCPSCGNVHAATE